MKLRFRKKKVFLVGRLHDPALRQRARIRNYRFLSFLDIMSPGRHHARVAYTHSGRPIDHYQLQVRLLQKKAHSRASSLLGHLNLPSLRYIAFELCRNGGNNKIKIKTVR